MANNRAYLKIDDETVVYLGKWYPSTGWFVSHPEHLVEALHDALERNWTGEFDLELLYEHHEDPARRVSEKQIRNLPKGT